MAVETGRHVVIIGAGVIGLSCARSLLRRGFAVTLLDRGPGDAGRDGCSFGNAGLVTPSHIVPLAAPGMITRGLRWMADPEGPFAIRPRFDPGLARWGWLFYRASRPARARAAMPLLRDLSLESRRLFFEWQRELGGFEVEPSGLIVLYRSAEAEEEEHRLAEAARSLGLEARSLTPSQVRELEPGVELDVRGGVHFPIDCRMDPRDFLNRLAQDVVERGGVLRWEDEVEDITMRNGGVARVDTTAGPLELDELLVAGGAWSGRLARKLGLRLPMQAGKGYSLTLESPPQMPRAALLLCEARVAVTPMGGKLRFGGTMEIGVFDDRVDMRRVRGVVRSVSGYLPAFGSREFRGCPVWTGLRPCSPDGLPYVGRWPGLRNLSIAAGHAMLGLSLAPATGEMIGAILAGEQTAVATELLAPDRYA